MFTVKHTDDAPLASEIPALLIPTEVHSGSRILAVRSSQSDGYPPVKRDGTASFVGGHLDVFK